MLRTIRCWCEVFRAWCSTALLAIFLGLFVLVSYLSQEHAQALATSLDARGQWVGVLIYLGLSILSVVAAPIGMLPLVPLAAQMWGGFWTGLLSSAGWTAGSLLAFWIARRFGKPLVTRFTSLQKIAEMSRRLPERNVFWTLVLLRMAMPADLLSYAVGLFTDVRARVYFWATWIGITPLAFAFAYAGRLPISYQLIFAAAAVVVFLVGLRFWGRTRTSN